ncbi:winged helix-turn-helix transcriptional regulator [Haloarcula sp. GH36]|uniref:winged helix-turn-helix transcriptional regulator n=1 Tax=Haloarcula montana TaxID=3111776 RepID=UPI002D7A02A2|nr:winged helix-turn-helix transcriptional regulator [Haloarcula sp. GH36]
MEFTALPEVLGRKALLEVLSVLDQEEALRYGSIEDRVDSSTDTLARSLRILSEYGLITRLEINPRRVEYQRTERGDRVFEEAKKIEEMLLKNKIGRNK